MKETLYKRLEKYVKIDTRANEEAKEYPSSKNQFVLGDLLLQELKEIGMKNVVQDSFGYVTAELPSNTSKKVPVVGFLAHMDTVDYPGGAPVEPKLHKNYQGGDIIINKEKELILNIENTPELKNCIGNDIVTASGNTVLGADDKAGIAIIMTAMEHLIKHPEIKHGLVKVAFTCDEEIGRGVDHFDVKTFGADAAYTIDGDAVGTIEDENFNANGLLIKIEGANVHPGSAKNKMTNAVRIASEIINMWPENMLPETTEQKEGFICFMDVTASVEKATIEGIMREHDSNKLKKMEKQILAIIDLMKVKYPQAKIEVSITEQYKNMKEKIDAFPQVMENLFSTLEKLNIKAKLKPVRGGTDGARLSFMGLPTPNIFTGCGNYHGLKEWASLDGMAKSVNVLTKLVEEWELKA